MMTCIKHNAKMQAKLLDSYTFEPGVVLRNVEAMVCPVDGRFTFTEAQYNKTEKRALAMKCHMFSFKRSITISGRSLVVNIPEDMVRHMHLAKGNTVLLRPVNDKCFVVEVTKK